eukprot:31098-Pelagococcus_subviridis.AAC.2
MASIFARCATCSRAMTFGNPGIGKSSSFFLSFLNAVICSRRRSNCAGVNPVTTLKLCFFAPDGPAPSACAWRERVGVGQRWRRATTRIECIPRSIGRDCPRNCRDGAGAARGEQSARRRTVEPGAPLILARATPSRRTTVRACQPARDALFGRLRSVSPPRTNAPCLISALVGATASSDESRVRVATATATARRRTRARASEHAPHPQHTRTSGRSARRRPRVRVSSSRARRPPPPRAVPRRLISRLT